MEPTTVAAIAKTGLDIIGGFFGEDKQAALEAEMMAARQYLIDMQRKLTEQAWIGAEEALTRDLDKATADVKAGLLDNASGAGTTTTANMLRSLYRDFGSARAKLARESASDLREAYTQTKYDIIDPSSVGANEGAKWGAFGDLASTLITGIDWGGGGEIGGGLDLPDAPGSGGGTLDLPSGGGGTLDLPSAN